MVRQLTNARWFDIGAARRDLGYEPRVPLEEGMLRLKAWLDGQDGPRGPEGQDGLDREQTPHA
jgi:nucleoside-diphosphate-sugar epimerase